MVMKYHDAIETRPAMHVPSGPTSIPVTTDAAYADDLSQEYVNMTHKLVSNKDLIARYEAHVAGSQERQVKASTQGKLSKWAAKLPFGNRFANHVEPLTGAEKTQLQYLEGRIALLNKENQRLSERLDEIGQESPITPVEDKTLRARMALLSLKPDSKTMPVGASIIGIGQRVAERAIAESYRPTPKFAPIMPIVPASPEVQERLVSPQVPRPDAEVPLGVSQFPREPFGDEAVEPKKRAFRPVISDPPPDTIPVLKQIPDLDDTDNDVEPDRLTSWEHVPAEWRLPKTRNDLLECEAEELHYRLHAVNERIGKIKAGMSKKKAQLATRWGFIQTLDKLLGASREAQKPHLKKLSQLKRHAEFIETLLTFNAIEMPEGIIPS